MHSIKAVDINGPTAAAKDKKTVLMQGNIVYTANHYERMYQSTFIQNEQLPTLVDYVISTVLPGEPNNVSCPIDRDGFHHLMDHPILYSDRIDSIKTRII